MKKLYILLFPFLLAASCGKKDDDQPTDKLPPATMTGANTFGCLVNGEVWLPHTGSIWDEALNVKHDRGWVGCDQLAIGVKKITSTNVNIYQTFNINVWCPVVGANTTSPSNGIFIDFEDCGNYRVDTLSPHVVNITKLDTINFIASGTFYFTAINDDCLDTIRITEGRFDVNSHL